MALALQFWASGPTRRPSCTKPEHFTTVQTSSSLESINGIIRWAVLTFKVLWSSQGPRGAAHLSPCRHGVGSSITPGHGNHGQSDHQNRAHRPRGVLKRSEPAPWWPLTLMVADGDVILSSRVSGYSARSVVFTTGIGSPWPEMSFPTPKTPSQRRLTVYLYIFYSDQV